MLNSIILYCVNALKFFKDQYLIIFMQNFSKEIILVNMPIIFLKLREIVI